MRFRVGPPWPLLASCRPRSHLSGRRPSFRRLHAHSDDSAAGQGATAAVLVMLGALHARRMYDDKKVVERKEKGIEPEFSPDFKASFFKLLPLRSMSRFWGLLMELEIPVFMRPTIYRAWARAFHSDLDEAALPLEEYPSLQAFFIRSLKEGSRPVDPDPNCLVSPVDGKVLQLGELRGPGTMIEQVKGHLFPQNERAVRTIRNLYVENERVVLEGQWKEGFAAIAAVGATNVGSIKLFVEPELRTNRPVSGMLHSQSPEERVYEPEGTGVMVKKGEEIAGFNMGSTVVVVFEAPVSKKAASSDFNFCIRIGDSIRVGEVIGRWRE
ncbi:hypothetical protein PR202_gb18270 [Eleusine coracana subsp. coracana]|uniref:Phosphatidylserine decarboxylase n=1 Tax=Eleusine coracana subsp. coracana TaxID=191504 RepID=A0AAV5F2W0_ELECO|nr:hypothetical protein PR202_gb18270 [Eleusine coracana subsp. coracana]